MQYYELINRRSNHTVQLLLISLFCFVMFFQSIIPGRYYIATMAVVLWLPTFFSLYPRLDKCNKSYVNISLALLLLISFYYVTGISKISVANYIREFTWLFAGIISVCALVCFSKKELRVLFYIFTIILVGILVLLSFFGEVLVYTLENDTETTAQTWMGSIVMLLSGISLIFFIHVKKMIPRLFALGVLIMTLYITFVVMQRATNILFIVAELFLILFFVMKNKWIVGLLSIVAIGIVIYLIVSDSLIAFFEWLAEITPERVSVRMQAIAFVLQYGDVETAGGSLASRNDLMGISWNTFTSSIGNFIFGVGERKNGNTIIGNHSFILDSLASYGIIGGTMLFVFFKRQYEIMMNAININTERVLYSQFAVIFAFYILRNLMGFLANSNVCFVLLLYIPLSIQILLNYKNNKQLSL